MSTKAFNIKLDSHKVTQVVEDSFEGDCHKVTQVKEWYIEGQSRGKFEKDSHKVMQEIELNGT